MEQIENSSSPPSEKVKQQERVTLGQEESKQVDAWLIQVNESSKGFLTLTKSDIVNFLVRQHKIELTTRELNQIRSDHYDPIRHITWITPQIKQALHNGDIARVSELQGELRKVELSVVKGVIPKHKSISSDGASQRRKRKPKLESMPKDAEQSVRKAENLDAQKSP